VSGPVTSADAGVDGDTDAGTTPQPPTVELTTSRAGEVGGLPVRRALPRRERRTVGAWCFVDHMGPATVDERGPGVAPHPHIGLQTVTWLLDGEIVHRDSLGTEQLIVPGQLNVMTAGHGVSHSEEGSGRSHRRLHGVQLWVAQPADTRDGPPAFEHHAELPRVDLENGAATIMIGDLGGTASAARRDTDHLGVELDLHRGATTLPLRREHEHALIVMEGAVRIGGGDTVVEPGHLAYLGIGREELALSVGGPTRALLVGGVPFDEPVTMWWNYVARSRDEIVAAHDEWLAGADRFGRVDSMLPRIVVGPPPWRRG
jgi:hypothetical protein